MAVTQLKQNPDGQGLDYASSGVNTDLAEDGLSMIIKNIKSTWPETNGPGGVLLPMGQFANVINVAGQGIAFCTDGVGSKALVAQMLNKYDTIGIDCVAMNVNDLICVGATPVSMVDYIAIESAVPSMLGDISIGLTEGAKQAGISISGGEIAQLPGMIHGSLDGHGFDLVGAAIGHVDPSRMLYGQDIQPGNVIIGVESSGIHSNGLTLARNVFFERNRLGIDHEFDELGRSIGAELLEPTLIYVPEALEILRSVSGVKGLVHITSDGLLNLARMGATVSYVIDALPPIPPIFDLIQSYGDVEDEEIFPVYNMGVGFCYVVEESSADAVLRILEAHGRRAWRIGHVQSREKWDVSIPEKKLKGRGRSFEKAAV